MESGYRRTGIREIRDGDGNHPGTGIWVSEVSGDWDLETGKARGQILDTYIKFEGLGIEIRVSGFGDWNPWTRTWV